MIYGIFIIALTAALSVLSVVSWKKRENCKQFAKINFALFILGVVLLIASYLFGIIQIRKFEADQELFGWLMDYYSLYYDLSVLPLVILVLVNVISAIIYYFDKRSVNFAFSVIREIVSLLSSLLLMILPYYGLFTQNDSVPMYIYMMISGIGMALTIRLSNSITLVGLNKHIARNKK